MYDQPVSMDTFNTIPRYEYTGGVGVDDGKVLRGSRWNWNDRANKNRNYNSYNISRYPKLQQIEISLVEFVANWTVIEVLFNVPLLPVTLTA